MKKEIILKGYRFLLITQNTKRAESIKNEFYYYRDNYLFKSNLYRCYNHFSEYKLSAFNDCLKMIECFSAYGGITTYSKTIFCYMFRFNLDGKHYIAKITKDNNFIIED